MDFPQDQLIYKKLLNRHDKRVETVMKEYLKVMFPDPQNPSTMDIEELIEEIGQLEFINFKNKTALISSNHDIVANEEEINKIDRLIKEAKQQIEQLQVEVKQSQIAKKNKKSFNQIGKQVKKYPKRKDFKKEMSELQDNIKTLEQKYNKEMKEYEDQERYIRIAMTSLKQFISLAPKTSIEKSGPILTPLLSSAEQDDEYFNREY